MTMWANVAVFVVTTSALIFVCNQMVRDTEMHPVVRGLAKFVRALGAVTMAAVVLMQIL